MAMIISPRAQINLHATITPQDALADSGSQYNLGFISENFAALFPTDATKPDIVYTRQFTLGAGLTKAFNMETMQITTIDATAPKDGDGNAISLTKIFAIAIRLVSTSVPANDAAIKLVNDTWAQPLLLELDEAQEGGIALMLFPAGAPVAAGALSNFIETQNDASNVVVDLFVLGKD